MIDKICLYLTNKIQKSMPDIDKERAEIINYGLQNIIGEIPKTFILLGIAYALGIFKLAILSFFIILPYRFFSGGFHLKSHLGCIIGTSIIYCGNVYISQIISFEPYIKYIFTIAVWIFAIIMIKLYAPADTENVPILRKKDRKIKQIASYIVVTISLIISIFVKDNIISNMIIFGMLIQTCTITKIAYKLTKNKYGYEVYNKEMSIN